MAKSKRKTGEGRFGMSAAEYENFKDMLRYGVVIVAVVCITFLIVAFVSAAFGFN